MQLTLSMAALAAATLLLSACKKAEAPPAAESSTAQHPSSSVTPQPANTPASANATGPAEGSTAIGGPAANQDQGGQNTSSPPAPTGGDGAAQAPPRH